MMYPRHSEGQLIWQVQVVVEMNEFISSKYWTSSLGTLVFVKHDGT